MGLSWGLVMMMMMMAKLEKLGRTKHYHEFAEKNWKIQS